MSVRFLHTADAHLGSPLYGLGAEDENLQAELREATYDAFRRLIGVALEANIEFVVVAGDLYDRESRSVRANQFAAEQFERLADADIPVYLIYGNHDPVETGIEYVDLPDNVHEFSADTAESVIHETDGEETACLCGQSYRRKTESRKFHTNYDPTAPGLPTIGLLHTGLNPDGRRYVPCDTGELTDCEDIDYWALGHIHQPRVHERNPVIAYPGIPQGRHINEAGVRGAYLVDLEADGTADLEFVPTSKLVWREEQVSIDTENDDDPPETVTDLRRKLEDRLQTLESVPDTIDLDVPLRETDWSPTGIMCRWVLTGRGPAHETLMSDEETIDILRNELRDAYDSRRPFIWTEDIRQQTGPPLPPIKELREDDPVFERFEETVEHLRTDAELRDELVTDKMGSVCEWDDGSEDEQPTRLEVTEEDLDRMIERAADLVANELRARRVD